MLIRTESCDVLVVGTGAAGLTAAVTAAKAGKKVILLEKDAVYGGTTAFSGGMIWIPGNRYSVEMNKKAGTEDSLTIARDYIYDEAGEAMDANNVEAYLRHGKEMVDYLERETEVKFYPMDYPDYVSENPRSRTMRSLCTVNYETRKMGPHLKTLRNQLPQTLFLGLAIGSSVEMKEFMRAGRSVKSLLFVLKKLIAHARDMIVYGRSEQMVRGRALVGRLARSAFDLGVQMWLSSPVKDLIKQEGSGLVIGALVSTPQGEVRVNASGGVILCCGGFTRDGVRRAAAYPGVAVGRAGAEQISVVPETNTGDGVNLAERAGGKFEKNVSQVAPWMPVSKMPGVSGTDGVWPHLVDRMKPGFISVARNGKRFADESSSYHDFIPGLIKASTELGEKEAAGWIVADARAVHRWGMGFARPWPVPKGKYVKNGYLMRADTLAELAQKAGMDAAGLEATVKQFNEYALKGVDPDFNRGNRTYDQYQGDPEVKPNSCLAPLVKAPFYAVRIYAAEIGTYAGIKTNANAQVVDADNQPIPGLYAAGNDQTSVFAGAYPGAGSTLGPAMTFGWIAGRHASGGHLQVRDTNEMLL